MRGARKDGSTPKRRPALPVHEASESESEPEELDTRPKRPRLEAARMQAAQRGAEDSGDSQSDTDSDGSLASQGSSSDSEGEDGADGAGELTLGQLVALKQDGSTTPAAMKARARALARSGPGQRSFKREGKHRPIEVSSKRPVPVLRDTVQGTKREVRDPRFESLSGGQYVEAKFKKQYKFLYDEALPQERKDIRAALKKCKNHERRAELQAQLTRVEQALRNEEARRKKEKFEADLKAKEREAVKAGKAPYFLKKSERRRLELLAKYQELKAGGRLDKFMAKRRKKNAAKDHRYLPTGRRGEEGAK